MNLNFAELYESLPQAAVVLGERGEVVSVNLAAEELLLLGRAKLLGKLWQEVVGAPELHPLIRRTEALREQAYHAGVVLATKAAPIVKHVTVNARVQPLGEVFTLLLLEQDDRANQWMEDDTRHEINRSAGVMAAMLAHEVNNPLSGIRGAAQLLGEDATDENKPLSELICKEVDRIRGVLDRVEMFADHSELPRESVNIHEALRHAKQVAEHGFARHVNFSELYDPSLPNVFTHRDSVVHIVLNLMKNACEAMAQVEAPTLTLTTGIARGVMLGAKTGSAIAVDIADNGPGIPAHLKAKLFKPFVTTHEAGRGLGLAICSKLAHDLGGRIELVDTQVGTKFRLLFECGPRG
jgi:two-component system, NtrC family, nitrogen regulation sensor histidine kinase GlnL